MAATLKNLESKPKDELEPADYEQEVKKRQYEKFRELIRDKVWSGTGLPGNSGFFSTTKAE